MKNLPLRALMQSLFLLLFVTLLSRAQGLVMEPADIIIVHGRVYTEDPKQPWARAIAIYKGKIVDVGDDAVISLRVDPAPSFEAGLVFAGYGLSIPDAGHDDFSQLAAPLGDRAVARPGRRYVGEPARRCRSAEGKCCLVVECGFGWRPTDR